MDEWPAGVHGNHTTNPKPHHRYEIYELKTGNVVKTGISGQPLNANGSSPRATPQVNLFNKEAGGTVYGARVVETNIPGRAAALEAEKIATEKLKAAGHQMDKQIRPK